MPRRLKAVLAAAIAAVVLVPFLPADTAAVTAKPTLVVALGSSLADVGVAVSLVAADDADALVMAASPEALGDDAAAVISDSAPSEVILVGGTAALSEQIESEITESVSGVRIERLWGATRTQTAAAAARRVLGVPALATDVRVAVANGWSLADVGSAAGLVAAAGADAVLYAGRDGLGEGTRSVLSDYPVSRVLVIGGTAALSETVRSDAVAAAGSGVRSRRLGGATRLHTAANVATAGAGDCTAVALIANGWSDADVGAAAALGAALGNSVVLYAEEPDVAGQATVDALLELTPQRILLVGEAALLDDALRSQLPGARSARRVDDEHAAARLALEGAADDCDGRGGGGGGAGGGGRGGGGGGGGDATGGDDDATEPDTTEPDTVEPPTTEPPPAPSTLPRPTVADATATTITIEWAEPATSGAAEITAYEVRHQLSGASGWTESSYPASTRSALFSGLDSDSDYKFGVRSHNGVERSDWSPTLTATTSSAPNANPRFTSPTTFNIAENTRNWSQQLTAEDDDTQDSTNFSFSLVGGADRDSFTVSSTGTISLAARVSLDYETQSTYEVSVQVVSGTGSRQRSVSQNITINIDNVPEVPRAPAAPTADALTSTGVRISWRTPLANTGPTPNDYDVQYSVRGSGLWTEFTSFAYDGSTRSVNVTGLQEGKRYVFKVRAINREGTGPWSSASTSVRFVPNNPPRFTTANSVSVTEGDDLSHHIKAVDDDSADASSITYTAIGFDSEFISHSNPTWRYLRWRSGNDQELYFVAPSGERIDVDYERVQPQRRMRVVIRAQSGSGLREASTNQTVTVTIVDQTETAAENFTATDTGRSWVDLEWDEISDPVVSAVNYRVIVYKTSESRGNFVTEFTADCCSRRVGSLPPASTMVFRLVPIAADGTRLDSLSVTARTASS